MMGGAFSHYCACGASWDLDPASPAEIEFLLDLISRTHKHTLGEVRAKADAMARSRIEPEDD